MFSSWFLGDLGFDDAAVGLDRIEIGWRLEMLCEGIRFRLIS